MAKTLTSVDPATGDIIWTGDISDAQAVANAYRMARSAQRDWAKRPLTERIGLVEKFGEIATASKAELGQLIARETGKILWDAGGEAGAVAGKAALSIKSYRERTGERSFQTPFGSAGMVHRPHGVMAVLGPYNFPAHLPNGQILPALIAGNAVVFKPSELTPATGERLVQMYREAGIPEGVVQIVQGGRKTGEALLAGDLDGVLFTGSAKTGALIHDMFGGRPEIVLALEMGGNNPLIVWDAEPEAAASIVVQSAFISSGQRCTCARRLIVADDAVVEAVLDTARELKPGADYGPVVSERTAESVMAAAKGLEHAGAKVLLAPTRKGALITPGIYDVTGLDVPDEEIFGPILQLVRVGDWDAAVTAGNATRFGLAAGLVSDRPELWPEFRDRIKAGVVNFNRPTTGASGALPFGGPGASGNHAPGAWYAADAMAWPMASQVSEDLVPVAWPGR